MSRAQHRPPGRLRVAPGEEPRPACAHPEGPDSLPAIPGWEISYVAETGSTNADLVQQAARGAADRTVLITDLQRAGRGRLGRNWVAPAGQALLFSVLLRPDAVPIARRGWIGALVGMAMVDAIAHNTGLIARLKWPNDVLIDDHKVAGILAEMAGDALVVGAGLNLTVERHDLPRADATSLRLAGARTTDRDTLLAAILTCLDPILARWYAAAGDIDAAGLRTEYVALSATIGRMVTVQLPDGSAVSGRAVDVQADGAVVIDDDGRRHRFAAGDIRHLRSGAAISH